MTTHCLHHLHQKRLMPRPRQRCSRVASASSAATETAAGANILSPVSVSALAKQQLRLTAVHVAFHRGSLTVFRRGSLHVCDSGSWLALYVTRTVGFAHVADLQDYGPCGALTAHCDAW